MPLKKLNSNDSLDNYNINDLFEILSDECSTFFKAQKIFNQAYHEHKGRSSNCTAPIMLRQRNITHDWKNIIEQIDHINSSYELNEVNLAELLKLFKELTFKNMFDDQKILIICNAVKKCVN